MKSNSTKNDPNLYVLDPQNETITSRNLERTLTVYWEKILEKSDNGKKIVCNLRYFNINARQPKFKEVLVTMRLIKDEEKSKEVVINGEIKYNFLIRSSDGMVMLCTWW